MSKKFVLFSILTLISILFSFFVLYINSNIHSTSNNNITTSTLSLDQWEALCAEQSKNDDLSFVYIDKSDSVSAVYSKLKIQNNNVSAMSANGAMKLSEETFSKLCKENDLHYYSEGDYYLVRNIYGLKRLIIEGKLTNTFNAKNVITGYKDYSLLTFNTIEETKAAYLELCQFENINVSPDVVVRASYDDKLSTSSTEYKNFSWGADAISLNTYNSYLETNNINKEVVVAVLDTGINTQHELFLDYDNIKGNRFLYDNNNKIVGYSYQTTTYNYGSSYTFEDDQWDYDDNGNRISPIGHGTHVSGTIVDLTPKNVKILPIKVLDYKGSGDSLSILNALNQIIDVYSKTYQITAVNMSLGGPDPNNNEKSTFTSVFNKLREKNILPIVAAGNKHSDTETFFPSACENAIVVSACKQFYGDYLFDSSYSNFGDEVDICAPGTAINSATIGTSKTTASTNSYVYLQGTSMAAPHVSAVVTLLCIDKSLYSNNLPQYTAASIENKLLNYCTKDYGTKGKDKYYGYGIVTLENLLFNFNVISSGCSATYDGNYHTINVNVTNSSNYTIKYSLDAKIYNITDITQVETFKNNTNGEKIIYYEISGQGFIPYYGQNTLQIYPKDITISIPNQDFIYGNINFDYQDYSATGLVGSDTLGLVLQTNAFPTSSIGDYIISIKDYSNKNYNVTNLSASAILTISPKPIHIIIENQTFTFGDEISIDNSKISLGEGEFLANNDTLSDLNIELTHNCNLTPTIDSNFAIFLHSANNPNYSITATNGNIVITKKDIYVTLQDLETIYKELINLDSLATFDSNEIISNYPLELDLTSTANIDSNIGEYTISVIGWNENYNVISNTSKHTISPRTITTTIYQQTFEYKEFNFDNSAFTYDNNMVLDNDSLGATLSTNATSESEVGEYDIYFSFENANYTPSTTSALNALKINQKEITITLTTTSFVYGEPIKEESFNQNENIDNLNISLIIKNQSVVANSTNPNYKVIITNLSEEIEITPRPIQIKTYQTFTYGEQIELDNTNFECENVLEQDKNSLLSLSTTANNKTSVGSYSISYTLNNSNYEITNFEGNVTITPRTLNVNINNKQVVYGDKITYTSDDYTIEENDLIDGDNAQLILSSKGKNAGNYKINAVCNNPNYTLNINNNGILTINKRKVTIKLDEQIVTHSFPIKFDNSAYSVVEGEVLEGDNLNINITAETSLFKQFGTFDLYATYDNGNYDITFETNQANVQISTFEIVVLVGILVVIISLTVLIIKIKRRRRY